MSVILTVYRRTTYLLEAIESALNQTYSQVEVIVADDSGTEAARPLLAAYEENPKVRYLPNPQTLGVAASVATAVQSARGEMIAILNDDDVWEREFLAELTTGLDAYPEAAAAYADHWVINAHGVIEEELSEAWSESFGRASQQRGLVPDAIDFCVVQRGLPVANGCLIRKAAIDWSLVVPEVSGAYDLWIALLVAATGRSVFGLPQRLARWRMHAEAETQRRSHDKGENLVFIWSEALKRGWFPAREAHLKRELAQAMIAVGRNKLAYRRFTEARSFFRDAFVLCPSLRSGLRAAAACVPFPIIAALQTLRRPFAPMAAPRDTGPARPPSPC